MNTTVSVGGLPLIAASLQMEDGGNHHFEDSIEVFFAQIFYFILSL